jgi:hypothetical protein
MKTTKTIKNVNTYGKFFAALELVDIEDILTYFELSDDILITALSLSAIDTINRSDGEVSLSEGKEIVANFKNFTIIVNNNLN